MCFYVSVGFAVRPHSIGPACCNVEKWSSERVDTILSQGDKTYRNAFVNGKIPDAIVLFSVDNLTFAGSEICY